LNKLENWIKLNTSSRLTTPNNAEPNESVMLDALSLNRPNTYLVRVKGS